MLTSTAILSGGRYFVLVAAGVFVFGTSTACRRKAPSNKNANAGDLTTVSSDPEQAKREAQSLVDQGKELYKNDQDERSAEILKQAIAQDSNNAEAHLRLGMAHAALGQKTEAEESYRKAIDLYKKKLQADQKDSAAYFNLGEAYSFLHQDDDAARSYRQATRLKPEDEEAFYQLGMSETRLAHYPEAVAAFKKALELDPEDYRATDAIEEAQAGASRVREGRKHASEMLKKQGSQNANGNSNSNSNSAGRPAPRHSPPKPPGKN